MKQKTRVLEMLASGLWICSSSFLKEYIPEYRSRINELRKEGYQVQAVKCNLHDYHEGNSRMWRLLSIPTKVAPTPKFEPLKQDQEVRQLTLI